MLQISSRPIKQTFLQEFILVLFIKHLLHCSPESFLPLEHSFLGNNVWCNLGIQATFEEQMCQISNIIIRIVVYNANIVIIRQISLVHHERCSTILGNVSCEQCSGTNLIPSSSVLSTNGMSLKQDLILVSQFNSLNMNCIPGDGNSIPSSSHGTIGRSPGLLQTHLLHLNRRGGDSRLLEDSSDTLACLNGIGKNLIIGIITCFTG
mmetsp:Transcript_17403/g.27290  ORF Transcript_17403/g.27290 Transcript_17403/m.27290 type:complete len:207 (-) Transcript_17403:88-708(-)